MTQPNSNNRLTFASRCAKDAVIESLNGHLPPIYATSTFAYPSVEWGQDYFYGKKDNSVYSRMGNPTNKAVAQKVASLEAFDVILEGKEIELQGAFFSSGMSAISAATMACLDKGEGVLAQSNLYGTTNELFQVLFPRYGMSNHLMDFDDLNKIEEQLKENPNIKLVYIETPANPTLKCYPFEEIVFLAKKYDCYTAVDNTFATPYFQRPFQFGVDLVVHSSTKFLNGHGTGISGVVIGQKDTSLFKKVKDQQKILGGNGSPFEAFNLNNGLKSLPLRMQRHEENALQLAQFLDDHSAISKVNYLGLKHHESHELSQKQMFGFGGMLSFEIKEGYEKSVNFLNKLNFCTLTASLGTPDTLLQHPASMSHVNVPKEQRISNGIGDGLIRVSVGIEGIEDILNDIEQALSNS